MKNLLGKEIKRGDEVIGMVGNTVHSGKVNQLYDTKNVVRISGYDLVIPAGDLIGSQDAWDALAKPLIEKRETEAAAVLAEAKANKDAEDKAAQEATAKAQAEAQAKAAIQAATSNQATIAALAAAVQEQIAKTAATPAPSEPQNA